MKKKLRIGLALITVMLITSCELDDSSAALDSIFETTWSLTVTDSQNITASSILKYNTTSYNIITTYIKGGESVVHKGKGSYSYSSPTVTMVAGSESEGVEILVGTIHNGRLYLTNSPYVFERQP